MAMLRTVACLMVFSLVCGIQPAGHAAESGDLYNVALLSLGATAKGSGSPFNRDWPPNNTLVAGDGRGGTIFGGPLKGGRVDIRLIVPVEIKAIEVVGLDYYGTMQPKAVDLFVDGKLLKHAELPETPGKPIRIPLEAKGQIVGILVTDDYPIRTLPNGKKGPNWGGWARLRVLSTTHVAEMMKPVEQYSVAASPSNIAPTAGSLVAGKVEVVGQPRRTKGHPCTLWDQEDIAAYKEMLKTSKELQAQLDRLKKDMDARMQEPLGIPEPKKGPDGIFLHLSDAAPLGSQTYGGVHNHLGLDIANLGTAYALTGDARYAEFCKKLLLAYADAVPNYGEGARPGFNHDPSKVFDQRLSDATWLIQVARGYDLIHDLPSITPEERKHIEDDLVKAEGRHIVGNHAMLEAYTNWSAIATCAVLAAGLAADDEQLINTAFWGIRGTKEKPTGGLFERHFGPKAIDEDGMWAEGAMGYQFMALEALVMDAEMLWHHGIDLYRYRDGALKRLFDTPLQIAYPDMTSPAIHDSGRGHIIGYEAGLYEFAYRRYRDPAYLLVLNQTKPVLRARFQIFPVSILYTDSRPHAPAWGRGDAGASKTEHPPAGAGGRGTPERPRQGIPPRERGDEGAPPIEWRNVNFFGVGYGILRLTDPRGTASLLLDYGPDRSHGHPDKLNLDLYAFNDQLLPDPGSVWYEQPIYRRWYHTTLAHNTLCVDELDQRMCGATQLVYGPADSFGLQRASCGEAYAGITMDRSLFLTADYVADLFGAFARLPREMDLAWHIRGQFASDLGLEPTKFPEPMENGYNELTNVRHASTDKPWSATVTRAGNVARFFAAGGAPTEVIVADGHYGLEKPPTILERRTAASTVYGNAIDISGAKEGHIRGVACEGGLAEGYALLKVQTAKGIDLCFAAYRPGDFTVGGLQTDAQQAFVVREGDAIRAAYLAGGKTLKVGTFSLTRSEPGLAYIEKAETGAFVVGNPSPAEATITVALDGLKSMRAYSLDSSGKRLGEVTVGAGGAVSIRIPPASRIEFAPAGIPSAYEHRQEMLRKRQADQEAALTKARDECLARTRAREAEAKAKPVPAGTVVVVQAEDFSAEGGGNVKASTTKRAAIGTCIYMWDAPGQWLEWAFDVPAEGYYHLALCYCSQMENAQRELQVNGEVQEPFAPLVFPTTGGWSNGSDDWRLLTASNPVTDQPLLIKLKQGRNVLRLTNANGRGINVDYLAVTSPDVKVDRPMLAGKLMGGK